MVIVPPQINKYYFMDLAPGEASSSTPSPGACMFVISWRNPGAEQRDWDMDDYAEAVLRVIEVVREITGSEDVNLLSFCAGGILTSTVLNHLAATGDARVQSASFGVTLLDFEIPAPIGMFDRPRAGAGTASRRAGRPRRPLARLGLHLAAAQRPGLELLGQQLPARQGSAELRHPRLERRLHQSPAALHSQFLNIFTDNALSRPGELTVLGTPVDLSRINVDTYVTGATTDHLTPWKAVTRPRSCCPGDSTFVLSNAGHIASLINPPGNPKAHYFAGPEPVGDADGWRGAERQPGPGGTTGATGSDDDRSGAERRAPGQAGQPSTPPDRARAGLITCAG